MFSIATVASSTRMPTASASPPSVITFSVSPNAHSAMIDVSTLSGIDSATMIVERQLPRKMQDHDRRQTRRRSRLRATRR